LLAGHTPYTEPDVSRKLHLKLTADPPPLHESRPDVPEGLSRVVQRMLARNPAHRFQTPDAAAAALEFWATPGPDFPARLFLPWEPTEDDMPGGATDFAQEGDPTPLPDTRSITRPKEPSARIGPPRPPSVVDLTCRDEIVIDDVAEPPPPDVGAPTVRLTRSPSPPTGFVTLPHVVRGRAGRVAAAAARLVGRFVSWCHKCLGSRGGTPPRP
jgi:hypothetical protein